MPATFPALVAETNALHRAFDAAADLAGAMLTIFENEHASASDNLFAWAHARKVSVQSADFGVGRDAGRTHRVDLANGASITVHAK